MLFEDRLEYSALYQFLKLLIFYQPEYSPSQEIEAESGRHGPQPPMQEQGSDWRGLGSTP